MELNGYELSRRWFDFSFENPELINPNHGAIYFFAVEHNNRLGWRNKFGFPSQMAMDAVGIKKHSTYIRYFNDLVEWGFFKLIQKSKNQYSANIISLQSAMPKNGKALDKAIVKHAAKQTESMGQSKGSIDKPLTINNKPSTTIGKVDAIIEELKISNQWHDSVALRLYRIDKRVEVSHIPQMLTSFSEHIKAQGEEYVNLSEAKKHFYNWSSKRLKELV